MKDKTKFIPNAGDLFYAKLNNEEFINPIVLKCLFVGNVYLVYENWVTGKEYSLIKSRFEFIQIHK